MARQVKTTIRKTAARKRTAAPRRRLTEALVERIAGQAGLTPRLSLRQIAVQVGVPWRTMFRWLHGVATLELELQRRVEEMRAAMIDDIEAAVMNVSVPHDEVTITERPGGDEGERIPCETRRVGVVDTAAALRVLQAHRPAQYSNRLDVKHGGGITVRLNVVKQYAGDSDETQVQGNDDDAR